jgi:hypothetical protein
MSTPLRTILLAAALASVAPAAFASVSADVLQRTRDPDWPCIQPKVEDLSVAAVWSGPPIEAALADWDKDPAVAALAREIAARRMRLDEAERAVAAFAAGLPAPEREAKLVRLFAGLFKTLDAERSDVLAGIDRYGRNQKALAAKIRADAAKAAETATSGAAASGTAGATNEDVIWQTRIFNERRASLALVCEVPTLIEQRFFTLARAIQAELAP